MHEITGEPAGKWKAWVKWIWLAIALLGGAWIVGMSRQDTGVTLAWAAVILFMMVRFRITEQRFDLLVDRHPVRVDIYTDKRRRTWIQWKSRGATMRACIQEAYCTGWVNHDITLDERTYPLRILVKPIGDGYMVFPASREFEMRVIRHSYSC
ncbi:hypothetical protein [Massilia sp. ST3]|uniref:hypothetical protein n=1 Tax=Massilia sp. ST3 TaxID=2824903 RepID=UPI001B83DBE3|nr:hypothetical protein [Massilia sp. ST3]MBQ5946970.1 hypothetical protein [Massilia sp. ST3]